MLLWANSCSVTAPGNADAPWSRFIIDEDRNHGSMPEMRVPLGMAARLKKLNTIFEGSSDIWIGVALSTILVCWQTAKCHAAAAAPLRYSIAVSIRLRGGVRFWSSRGGRSNRGGGGGRESSSRWKASGLGGGGVFEVAGFPEGAEGGEFFDEGAVVGPAGWDEFVVEVVAGGEPVDPVG